MDFNKRIKNLERCDLNCNVFSVYDYDGLSMQELLCQFFTKINECVKSTNDTLDLLKWLVEVGIKEEVAKQLLVMIEDGTIAKLINETIFKELNDKIDGLYNLKKNLGIAISLKAINYNSGDNLDLYKEQILLAKSINASVELVCFICVINDNDTSFIRVDFNGLIKPIIDYAKENKVKISLAKIHLVKTLSSTDFIPNDGNNIKGNIGPLEGQETIWFENYAVEVKHLVDNFLINNITNITIGNENELVSTKSKYTEKWSELIQKVKTGRSIKIGYSLHVGEQEYFENEKRCGRTTMLDYLDFIGINTYPMVSNKSIYDGTESIQIMKKILTKNVNIISKLYRVYPDKDFIITETGSMGRKNSLNRPIDTSQSQPKDSKVQGIYIGLMIDELSSRDYIKGFYIWHIREPFNIIGTEAEDIVRKYYGKWGL
ncbi:MAG: glycoside hydrolase family 113 [Paraclostridium sp.]